MRDEGIEIVNELEDGPVPAAAAAGRADSSGSKKYTTSCTRRGVAIRAIAALVAITGLAVALGLAFGTSAGTNGSVSSAMSSAAATVEDCLEEEKRAIAEYYNSRGRRSLRKEGSADVAAAEKIVLGEESAVGRRLRCEELLAEYNTGTPESGGGATSSAAAPKSAALQQNWEGSKDEDEIDFVLEWNYHILQCNIMDHNGPLAPLDSAGGRRELYNFFSVQEGGALPAPSQGPPASARVSAMIHLAMIEAYNCITGVFGSYYDDLSHCGGADNSGASMQVAVAKAAHDVIVAVYAHLDKCLTYTEDALQDTMARESNSEAMETAMTIGSQVAAKVLDERSEDGYGGDDPYLLLNCTEYTPKGEPGYHNVDPENPQQGFLSPCFGEMGPMTMSKRELNDFMASAPPGWNEDGTMDLNNSEYLAAVMQVKSLGRFRGGTEGEIPLDDETYITANFWSANGSPKTGTPTTMYMDILRKVAIEQNNSVEDNMLLFATASMSLFDTGVSTWQAKYKYDLWRPELAIHHVDGNDTWRALRASRSNGFDGEKNFIPPFPSHTSGHAAFGCAAFQTLANFYGTYDIPVDYTSPEWNGDTLDQFGRTRQCITRSFSSIKGPMAQNAASRVFNGVHYGFEGTLGCEVGIKIANYVWQNKFLRSSDSGREKVTADDITDKILAEFDNQVTSGHQPDMCDETPPYPFVKAK